jgi:hypothetical protein
MWDEPILEKIEDELIPRPRTARIPPARLSLTTLTPPASSRQQRCVLLQTSTVAPGDEARLLQASQCHLLALVAREHLCSAVSHHTASTMGFSSVAAAALVADFVSASVTTSKSLMNGTASTTTSPRRSRRSQEPTDPRCPEFVRAESRWSWMAGYSCLWTLKPCWRLCLLGYLFFVIHAVFHPAYFL